MDLDQQVDNLAANGQAQAYNCVCVTKKNMARAFKHDGEEKIRGDPNQGSKTGYKNKTEQAGIVWRLGRFDWHGFFKNPRVLLQSIIYLVLLYTITPRSLTMGLLPVCFLLFLPICVLNLMGTHMLTLLAAKLEKQDAMRYDSNHSVAEDDSNAHIIG